MCAVTWQVEFTDQYGEWYAGLSERVQDVIGAKVHPLETLGPSGGELMPRPYREIFDAMPAERRARIQAEADRMLADIRLRDLRATRDISQADLAIALDTDQGNISRLEKQADMYVSTLRRYLEALGGTLDIIARFPDRDVRISQFKELRRAKAK